MPHANGRGDRACAVGASTQFMIQSFIFSKPNFVLEPFEEWDSSIKAKSAASDARAARRRGIPVPPSSAAETKSAVSRHASPSKATAEGAIDPISSTHRPLRAIAWKRRSFVDQVEKVPFQYQHRSVVPAVSLSPRSAQMLAHHHTAPQVQGGGIGPLPHQRPSSSPMHVVHGRLSDVFHDTAEENRRLRRHLEQRVTHVRDEVVCVRQSLGSTGLRASRPATGPPRLQRELAVPQPQFSAAPAQALDPAVPPTEVKDAASLGASEERQQPAAVLTLSSGPNAEFSLPAATTAALSASQVTSAAMQRSGGDASDTKDDSVTSMPSTSSEQHDSTAAPSSVGSAPLLRRKSRRTTPPSLNVGGADEAQSAIPAALRIRHEILDDPSSVGDPAESTVPL